MFKKFSPLRVFLASIVASLFAVLGQGTLAGGLFGLASWILFGIWLVLIVQWFIKRNRD